MGEIRFIENWLANALNKHHESRAFANRPENERTKVSHNIGNAISDIRDHMPELADHLSTYIHRSYDCIYQPIEDIKWKTMRD